MPVLCPVVTRALRLRTALLFLRLRRQSISSLVADVINVVRYADGQIPSCGASVVLGFKFSAIAGGASGWVAKTTVEMFPPLGLVGLEQGSCRNDCPARS
jgi:hypothetical protein